MNEDTLINRVQIRRFLGVTSETIRRWMISGKLPKPDVDLSRRTKAWKLSTLEAAGIRMPFPPMQKAEGSARNRTKANAIAIGME